MSNKISAIENGPLVLESGEDCLRQDGKFVEKSDPAYLCRCGHSKNKPFCDGTHSKTGFQSKREIEQEVLQVYEGKEITVHFNRSICSGAALCVRALRSSSRKAPRTGSIRMGTRLLDGNGDDLAYPDMGALEHDDLVQHDTYDTELRDAILLTLKKIGGSSTTWEHLMWDPGVGTDYTDYYIYRGELSSLGYDDWGTCRAEVMHTSQNEWFDWEQPVNGGFFYLISEEDSEKYTEGYATCAERSNYAHCDLKWPRATPRVDQLAKEHPPWSDPERRRGQTLDFGSRQHAESDGSLS